MLEIADLSLRYGQHLALDAVSLRADEGEMVAILGANGAGKSSLLGAIGGRVRPEKGTIRYRDHDILALPQYALVERGIAVVPEGRGIFPGLSVADNLALGARPERAQARAEATRADVFALFPKLAERRRQIAGTMSGGEQQMVAIGRALMSAPDLLLLDEPSLGLAPIVAQNARATLALADRAYLIQAGRITGSGTAESLRTNPAVVNAFLGGAAAAQS